MSPSRGPLWLAQQLIPPLLLTYFYFAWKICTFEAGPLLIAREHGHPTLAWIYAALPTLFIVPITLLYLRLYFLPSSQCVPPFDPPPAVQAKRVIFQCLSPAEAEVFRIANGEGASAEDEPMAERCYKGTCKGRWKPARSRHCSQCGKCRAGFDHHCPFFANCLTAAYMPTFLALLLYTPPAVLTLSLPLYSPIFHRAAEAYVLAWRDEAIRTWWWGWKWSWVVAGGPVGRYVGGVILGWKELDRVDGGGVRRLNVGLVLGFSIILILITMGLAISTITVIMTGDLTIDKGRSSAHAEALRTIHVLQQKGQPISSHLEERLARFSDTKHFFVPVPSHPSGGVIVDTLDHERPYDHGTKRNLEIVLGRGWGWLLPWRAVRKGIGEEVFSWPLAEDVERRLKEEAQRRTTSP